MARLSRPRARVIAPGAAAAVAAAMVLGGQVSAVASTPAGASANTGATASTDVAGTPRVLTRQLSKSFPAGQHKGSGAGYSAPEFPRLGFGDEAAKASRASGANLVNRSFVVHPREDAQFATAAGQLAPPVVRSTPLTFAKPGLRKSFQGLNLLDQRSANGGNQFTVEPPDQALCVGNGYVLESVNDVLRVFKTSGAAASPVTDLNSFYGYPAQFNRTTGRQGPFVTDPVCVFDHETKHFFVTVLTLEVVPKTGALTGKNHLDIAVSKTRNPLGGYNIYRLPVQDDGTQGTPRHKDCPCIGDYPHIGVDASGIYLTTNEFPLSTDGFNGAQIYGFDKHALARGATRIRGVQFQSPSLGSNPGFTVWPAQSPDTRYAQADNGTEYLLSSVAVFDPRGMADQIGVWELRNTHSLQSSSPNVRLRRSLIHSNVYGVPPLVTQKVGPVPLRDCLVVDCLGLGMTYPNSVEGPIDPLDSRMFQTWYANGRIYGSLGTIVQVGGNIKAGIAYYVVNPGSSPSNATMARQGYIAKAGDNVIFPSIATLANGRGVIAMTLVGRHHYPSAAYTTFGSTGPGRISVAGMGKGPQDGFSEYPAFSNRVRFGDYGAAVTDGSSLWFANEYIAQSCNYAQYVKDTTCGGTRATLGNWSTRISQVTR